MKITANIATMKGRELHLYNTLKNLYAQFDKIRIVFNGFKAHELPHWTKNEKIEPILLDEDLTDNGKFYSLNPKRNEYYFTLDDDIIYPDDYVSKTTEYIENYQCIVTYHGRVLNKKAQTYYRGGHEFFHCANRQDIALQLDVCGTGVTAFRTDYFCPDIAYHPYKRMSDLVFSLEAKKQGKVIGIVPKGKGWIEPQEVEVSIFSDEINKKQTKQVDLMKKIIAIC